MLANMRLGGRFGAKTQKQVFVAWFWVWHEKGRWGVMLRNDGWEQIA